VGGVTAGVASAVAANHAQPSRGELGAAMAAARSRIGLVALLLGLTTIAWWATVDRMAGMDAGPSSSLGALSWFLGVWVVMMAAMMLPALAPTVALYAAMTRRRGLNRPLLFAGSYLLVWGGAGVMAYGLVALGRSLLAGDVTWDSGGRWLAAGVLLAAAVYELTPLKDTCLSKCRSPLGFLLGSWRDGRRGAAELGARHAAWCLGCCWALMAGLFALGVMSVPWMALIAVLITLEKILPWKRAVSRGTAALLLALAVGLAAAPQAVPGLVIPTSQSSTMSKMTQMHTDAPRAMTRNHPHAPAGT
jgi:predicted metal-binding membrane protein